MIYHTKDDEIASRHAIEYLESIIKRGGIAEVKQVVKSRSKDQNSYFHVIVKLFSDYTGYELKEAKDQLKRHCGLAYKHAIHGTWHLKSTKSLDVAEFSEFLDTVIRWCAMEHNIVVPPSEHYK